MKVNCLGCGHNVAFDDSYDDYEGQVKCFACGTILEIRTEGGKLQSVRFVKMVPRPTTEEVLERTT